MNDVILSKHDDGTGDVCYKSPDLGVFINEQGGICLVCNAGEDNDKNFLMQYWEALSSIGQPVSRAQMDLDIAEMAIDPEGFRATLAGPLAEYLAKRDEDKRTAQNIAKLHQRHEPHDQT